MLWHFSKRKKSHFFANFYSEDFYFKSVCVCITDGLLANRDEQMQLTVSLLITPFSCAICQLGLRYLVGFVEIGDPRKHRMKRRERRGRQREKREREERANREQRRISCHRSLARKLQTDERSRLSDNREQLKVTLSKHQQSCTLKLSPLWLWIHIG